MEDQTNVLVIGGSAAGIVAATTGKSNYPDKDFFSCPQGKRGACTLWYPLHFWFIGEQ